MKNKILKTINVIMAMIAAVGIIAGNSENVLVPFLMIVIPCVWAALFLSANSERV